MPITIYECQVRTDYSNFPARASIHVSISHHSNRKCPPILCRGISFSIDLLYTHDVDFPSTFATSSTVGNRSLGSGLAGFSL